MQFAEVGVLIMLFMMGLGDLEVSCTDLAVMGTAMVFRLDAKPAFAEVITVAPSSTVIAIQKLQEKGLLIGLFYSPRVPRSTSAPSQAARAHSCGGDRF